MLFTLAREINFVVLPALAVILFACSGSDAAEPDLEVDEITTAKVSDQTQINEPTLNVLSTPDLVDLLKPSVVQIAVNFDRGRGVGTSSGEWAANVDAPAPPPSWVGRGASLAT